jgi:hypothetical protein
MEFRTEFLVPLQITKAMETLAVNLEQKEKLCQEWQVSFCCCINRLVYSMCLILFTCTLLRQSTTSGKQIGMQWQGSSRRRAQAFWHKFACLDLVANTHNRCASIVQGGEGWWLRIGIGNPPTGWALCPAPARPDAGGGIRPTQAVAKRGPRGPGPAGVLYLIFLFLEARRLEVEEGNC